MDVTLTHPFKDAVNIDALLADCNLVNTFCHRLEQQATEQTGFDPNKFKGDGLECLVEFLIKYQGTDNNIGITDYQVIPGNDDTGVDGRGISTFNKRPITVQVKFRQANYILEANKDHLTNFTWTSVKKYGVLPSDDDNMLIISTGNDLNHFTRNEMLRNGVRFLGRPQLREMLDGKGGFWNDFRRALHTSRTVRNTSNRIVLRQHQAEAVAATRANDKGIIELPTGTGKTFVQAERLTDLEPGQVGAVFSPRILLSFQHLKAIGNYLRRAGIDAEFLNVNSGRFPETDINLARAEAGFAPTEVPSTTNPTEIREAYEKAIKANKPLIISSTYHSANQIVESGIPVEIQLNDEAHNLVPTTGSNTEFSEFANIGKLVYFFTATPKNTDSDEGLGMNNVERFGETIYRKTPKEMIGAGEMLPIMVHTVIPEHNDTANHGQIFQCIWDTFLAHEREVERHSRKPETIAAKLLVTLDGQETLRGILNGREYQEWLATEGQSVRLLAISSDIGVYIDGLFAGPCANGNKQRFFNTLATLGDTERVIILNVDMLGEGIDVPGITGFMPIRSLPDPRMIQGLGRACRLEGHDRAEFYQGTLTPAESQRYIKPFAWVIIPQFQTGSEDYAARYESLLKVLISEYGLDPELVVATDMRGIDDKSKLDPISLIERKGKFLGRTEIGDLIHRVYELQDRPLDIDDLAVTSLARVNPRMAEMLLKKFAAR